MTNSDKPERILRRNRIRPLVEGFVALGLVALPWSLGGAPQWTVWPLLLSSAGATVAWIWGATRYGRRLVTHPVLWVGALIVLVTALQLLPLPPFLLRLLSPRGGDLRDFALVPLGLERWRPITVDVPSTLRALAVSIADLGLLFVSVQLGRKEEPRKRLYAVVVGVGLSVVLTGFGHLIASEDALFGAYKFATGASFITSFGNANHLAAYLTLACLLAIALAFDSKERENLVGYSFAAMAMGAGVFLSLSRGGIGAFMVGLVAAGSVVAARRIGGLRSAAPWAVIAAVVGFAALLSFEQVVERAKTVSSVERLQATKLEMWPSFTQASWDYARAGMGRGAFELGYTGLQPSHFSETFTHPENLVFQWACEVGLLFSLGLLALSLFSAWVTWKDSGVRLMERLAMVAVAAVLLHEQFDFSAELNAVGPTLAVVIGLVAGAGIGKTGERRPPHLGWTAASALVFAAAAFAGWKGLPDHRDAEQRLGEAVRAATKAEAVRPLALELIDRHPNDWILYADMAHLSARLGDPREALAWANRVLYLRPQDGRAHVDAGRALLRLGQRTQALLEFRLASEAGNDEALPLALAVAAKEGDYERLLTSRRGFVTAAVDVLRQKWPLEVPKLLAKATQDAPTDEVKLEAQVLVASTTAETGDPEQALALLAALPEAERDRSSTVLWRRRALQRAKRPQEAVELLERRLTASPGEVEVAAALIDDDIALGRLAAARAVVARIRPFAASPAGRIELFVREASLWEMEGRIGKALDCAQTASRIEPNRPDLHYLVARYFEQMGSANAALDEVRKGRLVDTPEGAALRDPWIKRLEAVAQSSLPRPAEQEPAP